MVTRTVGDSGADESLGQLRSVAQMQMQAENLRIYSLAWSQFHDRRYLAAAQAIHHFLIDFLRSPNGAFYTSMDADLVDGVHSADYFALSDSARRARGIPHVDEHPYTRENAWAIRALVALYESTGDRTALDEATTAATWIIARSGAKPPKSTCPPATKPGVSEVPIKLSAATSA